MEQHEGYKFYEKLRGRLYANRREFTEQNFHRDNDIGESIIFFLYLFVSWFFFYFLYIFYFIFLLRNKKKFHLPRHYYTYLLSIFIFIFNFNQAIKTNSSELYYDQ